MISASHNPALDNGIKFLVAMVINWMMLSLKSSFADAAEDTLHRLRRGIRKVMDTQKACGANNILSQLV